MKLSALVSVLPRDTYVMLHVNGGLNASVDAGYLLDCAKAGDPRGDCKVTCVKPEVFHHYTGNAIPQIHIDIAK